MSLRYWLTMIAALLLIAAAAVCAVDRFFTWRMVGCLKQTFGDEGAPMKDLPQCDARWDGKLGHKATRALFADAAGPFGALQRASVASWAAGTALLLLFVAAAAQGGRTRTEWTLTLLPVFALTMFLGAYVVALHVAADQTPRGWRRAQQLLDSALFAVAVAGGLSVLAARRGGARAKG